MTAHSENAIWRRLWLAAPAAVVGGLAALSYFVASVHQGELQTLLVGVHFNLLMVEAAALGLWWAGGECAGWKRNTVLFFGLSATACASAPGFALEEWFDYTLPLTTAVFLLWGLYGWFAIRRRRGWRLLQVSQLQYSARSVATPSRVQFTILELLTAVTVVALLMAIASTVLSLPNDVPGWYSWHNPPSFWFGFFGGGGLVWVLITLSAYWATLTEPRPKRGWLAALLAAALCGAAFTVWSVYLDGLNWDAIAPFLSDFVLSATVGSAVLMAWLLWARRLGFRYVRTGEPATPLGKP